MEKEAIESLFKDVLKNAMPDIISGVSDSMKSAGAITETPPANQGGEGSQTVTVDSMKALLSEIVSNKDSEQSKNVFDAMFKDKMNAAKQSIKGFDDYISEKDDFGQSPIDRLDGIESYEDRVKALETISSKFSDASANSLASGNGFPTQKQQEAFDNKEKPFDEVEEKFLSGEIPSTGEHLDANLALIIAEMNGE